MYCKVSHRNCFSECFYRLQEEYSKEFTIFKPDKKLRWLPHLGSVTLELALEDRTIEVNVPPLEAAFIELFSEKGMVSYVSCCTRESH